MRSAISLFAIVALARAASANKRCTGPQDSEPWVIQDITVFAAQPGSGNSSICFHFCDPNTDLRLDTECERTVADSTTLSDPEYFRCDNDSVSFAYADNSLSIMRGFENDWYVPYLCRKGLG